MWKVLIADDERLICRLVQALADWERLDMEVAGTAENGLEALDMVRELSPDILVTDIRMPGCDGLELIRKAKELCPALEIVIISGYAHFEYAQSAMSYGVGNYLLKPIQKEELNKTLEKIGERLTERQERESGSLKGHRNNEKDLNRLREGLIKDLLGKKTDFTLEELHETYHFTATEDTYRVFVLKSNAIPGGLSPSAASVIQEKVREFFVAELSGTCPESLLSFEEDTGCGLTGYGILNYPGEKKNQVRGKLRDFLNKLEANRNLLGKAAFSLALGGSAHDPSGLYESLSQAKTAIHERLLEGCGRILEGVPAPSALDRQGLLDRYAKAAEHAIEAFSAVEAREAAQALYSQALSVKDVRGRELMELVLSAGRYFILRSGVREGERTQLDFEARCDCAAGVEELFEELYRQQDELVGRAENQRRSEANRPVRIAKQYIMENFHKNITLEEVCEAAGFSVTYFSALFKRETGEGFAKYLTRVRMEEAKNLLRDTNLTVSEICERVGYSDRKHFTQTFHKATGLNPAEYRKLYG